MAPKFDVTPEKRASFLAFVKRQLFITPPLPTRDDADLAGKTAIVTGANSGIGLECSRQLLDLGLSRLIIAVRSKSRGEAAKRDLLVGRDAEKQRVEVWLLDLEKYESITGFVERAKELDRLDIVVNNAGMMKKSFGLVESTGHEYLIQINYLSMVLLTILLLPIIKEKQTPAEPGRVVLVNSDAAAQAQFKERSAPDLLEAFDQENNFSDQERYWTSKLLGQLFLTELAKRVPSSVAVVNAPNPGLTRSNLGGDYKGTVAGFLAEHIFLRIFGRTPAVGARSVTCAAVLYGQESHGQYIEDGKIQPLAPLIYKPEGAKIAERLWRETMEDLAPYGVSEIVDKLTGA
ncbi:hypothetical protein PFICI_00051 [Pestalotiopsis fici W106-1]|uniref:Uncharacterized protein n=1 Tax=Pestalotiopsis fici (strain W106-1 / CGMCC3.15140) TaxID=1229662 RepID=W3XJN4_PESFW|nr:uncharacterized protein PFICI_00051 [Pestalotiopsis fici W106-1]ETS86223.1 hypothetical protein PFICI_00051 [Pestalotiopsis fici W106-1]